MSRLASLPDEVLKLVLQKVPLKQRLSSCSLVSRRLHEATAVATGEVSCSLWGTNDRQLGRADSFLLWLDQYGRHVTRLNINGFPRPLTQLPCAKLRHLYLDQCSVQLGLADGRQGVFQGLTKLTRLELVWRITVAGDGVLGDSLSQLLNLRHLSVFSEGVVLSGATLAGLQRLTRLHACLETSTLPHLSALTDLKQLTFQVDSEEPVGPASVPGLLFPGSLTKLVLHQPVEAGTLSVVPTGLRELYVAGGVHSPAEGPCCFLPGLARLQHLTALYLYTSGLNWPPPGPAYSALTASLVTWQVGPGQMPAGTWTHVFPAGHRLPELTSLVLHCSEDEAAAPPSVWDAADVSSLVEYGPNLREITGMRLQAGPHVSELHKLTGLSNLDLQYGSASAMQALVSMRGLAALKQLRRLRCELGGPGWSFAALLPLTSLTALTQFSQEAAEAPTGSLYYHSTRQAGAPDVWLQLLGRCAAEDTGQEAALCSLAGQLDGPSAAAVHKAVTVSLHRQLGSQQRHNALQDEQLEEQDELLSQLEQQKAELAVTVAAQSERITAQEARINGLQAQLAQQQQVAEQQAAQMAGLQAQGQELLQRLPAP